MANETGNNAPYKTKLIIAHPYPLVREGLYHILSEAGFQISGQVGDLEALFQAASENSPDMIIVDFRIIGGDAGLVDRIKKTTGAIVAIVAVPEQIEEAPEALKAGAKGYLSYSQTSEEFLQSLSLLAKGSVIVSNVASEHVQSAIHKDKQDASGISEREKDVVILVAKGATNREIADKLMVSQHTIKIHLHSILSKLNLRNRQQIAAYAVKQGLVEDIQTEDFSRRD
jgi:two-component system nitrate/nitrite response regulator NarL